MKLNSPELERNLHIISSRKCPSMKPSLEQLMFYLTCLSMSIHINAGVISRAWHSRALQKCQFVHYVAAADVSLTVDLYVNQKCLVRVSQVCRQNITIHGLSQPGYYEPHVNESNGKKDRQTGLEYTRCELYQSGLVNSI